MSRYYRFKKAEYFNKFCKHIEKGKRTEVTNRQLPMVDPDDGQGHVTDREILEKYINLNNSCLSKEEKTKGNGHAIQV